MQRTTRAMFCVASFALTAFGSWAQARKTVECWYFWKGDEAKIIESIIADYNNSQNKYLVKGLSVPDKQKLITAISGGEGPDVFVGQNTDVPSFAYNGLLEAIEPYAKKTKDDIKVLSPAALGVNSFEGKLYAIPSGTVVIGMYYNKTLLKEAGITTPPKTMEELFKIAPKLTKTDAKGNIVQIGFPLFPLKAYPQEGAYAFGARYRSIDGKLTPDNPGLLKALEMNVAFRKLYGFDKMGKYVATSNTARYTPQDQFFQGRQAFRFDGIWLTSMIATNAPSLDYGIVPVPGTESDPTTYGATRLETDAWMLPVTGRQKDGGWDFIRYMTMGGGAKKFITQKGDVPALMSLARDSDVLAMRGMKEFTDILAMNRAVPFPVFPDSAKYLATIIDYAEYAYSGKMTPAQAMAEAKKVTDTLTLK